MSSRCRHSAPTWRSARWPSGWSSPGDVVRRGDVVAVVETEKSTIEVEIFEAGVIEELLVPEGDEVPVGTVLARVGAPDSAPRHRHPPPHPPRRPHPRRRARPRSIVAPARAPTSKERPPWARRLAGGAPSRRAARGGRARPRGQRCGWGDHQGRRRERAGAPSWREPFSRRGGATCTTAPWSPITDAGASSATLADRRAVVAAGAPCGLGARHRDRRRPGNRARRRRRRGRRAP